MITARSCIESLTRDMVFSRRFPPSLGGEKLYVSPSGGLRYLRRDLRKMDPELLSLAKETINPGAVVWDVGANVGLFSVAAAGLAGPLGRVYAVEPDAWLIQLLRKSASHLSKAAAPVTVLPVALADSISIRSFCLAKRSRSTNFLEGAGSTQTGGVREKQSVFAVTLDWLAEQVPAPDVLKIDCEGVEDQVLDGGRDLLRRHKPTLICEVRSETQRRVSEVLLECGYIMCDGALPKESRRPVDLCPLSLLAVPTHKWHFDLIADNSGSPNTTK